MKIHKPLFNFLLVLFISLIACHKTGKNGTGDNMMSTFRNPFILPDRDYFWELDWNRTSNGDEINLIIPRLTDSVLRKGVKIGLAVYSDWDLFGIIPFEYYDMDRNGSIHFLYEVIPGHLKIIAKAHFQVTYPSDVYVQYN